MHIYFNVPDKIKESYLQHFFKHGAVELKCSQSPTWPGGMEVPEQRAQGQPQVQLGRQKEPAHLQPVGRRQRNISACQRRGQEQDDLSGGQACSGGQDGPTNHSGLYLAWRPHGQRRQSDHPRVSVGPTPVSFPRPCGSAPGAVSPPSSPRGTHQYILRTKDRHQHSPRQVLSGETLYLQVQ